MATDDRFRQYSAAGEEFLEAARARAVEFLRELSRVGQSTQREAQGQVDDLVEAGRRGTDQILEVIRKEIAAQLGALGLATKADLADLERRLTAAATGAASPAKKVTARKTAAKKAEPAAAPAASKSTAKSVAAAKKAPAKKAAGTRKSPGAGRS